MSKKIYDEDGMRLTDCCGAHSSYDQNGDLYCKACWGPVSVGEGDGSEYDKEDERSEAYLKGMSNRVGQE